MNMVSIFTYSLIFDCFWRRRIRYFYCCCHYYFYCHCWNYSGFLS
jgi:hypothetical protein